MPSTPKSTPSCMTVNDNVAVAVVVSEILPIDNFPVIHSFIHSFVYSHSK